jgi:hypothetical protein
MKRSRCTRESASALTFAIIVMILGMIVVAAIVTMLDWSGERGRSRNDRASNVAVVDRALASYEFALESNLTNDFHRFQLNSQAMTKLASSESSSTMGRATPRENSSFGADFRRHGLQQTWMGNQYGWSMQTSLKDGRTSWWQLVNTIPPGTGNATLVAYVRTWIAAGGPGSRVLTEPRIARAELRPGRFSDYQLLVDGPLVMGAGTRIEGRIHSNGYPDAYLTDAFTSADRPIVLGNALGRPSCVRGAAFSTAKGSISGSCSGFAAPRDENNGRLIDMLRGESHLELLRSMCGAAVFCPGGSGPWSIDLSSMRVNGQSIPGAAKAVYVRGDASLRGTTTRQITIGVAGTAGASGAFGSSSISLVGNGTIGAANTASAAGGIVGLIVTGDIVPRIDQGSCPRGLNAAVVSASGSLSFPAQYRVPLAPGGSTPTCPSFRLVGSLSSHYAPLMFLAWGAQHAGYDSRSYQYDPRLRTTPPPLFPLTGPWQVNSWKDAMSECLSAANRTRSECG